MTTTDLRVLCEEVRRQGPAPEEAAVPECPCSVCFFLRAAPLLAGECERLMGEVERLRAVIEGAPHMPWCPVDGCTCWKARALVPAGAERSET